MEICDIETPLEDDGLITPEVHIWSLQKYKLFSSVRL